MGCCPGAVWDEVLFQEVLSKKCCSGAVRHAGSCCLRCCPDAVKVLSRDLSGGRVLSKVLFRVVRSRMGSSRSIPPVLLRCCTGYCPGAVRFGMQDPARVLLGCCLRCCPGAVQGSRFCSLTYIYMYIQRGIHAQDLTRTTPDLLEVAELLRYHTSKSGDEQISLSLGFFYVESWHGCLHKLGSPVQKGV